MLLKLKTFRKRFFTLFIFVIFSLISLQYILFLSHYSARLKADPVSNSIINDNLSATINLGFNVFAYEEAKLEENKLKQKYDLTAVLLHWQRLDGIQKTLEYILHSNLFKEIIVWNNNPHIHLTSDHFIKHNNSNKCIRIINSEKNLKDEAKYRACAAASTKACFYVDDDWNVSHYLKGLIASFRSEPYLLHTVTDPYTYYTNLIWSYFDEQIDLHSGFSWIGCGSVFLRQHARKHLQLVHKFLQNHTELILLSDVFFSIWLNNLPVQMITNIQEQPSQSLNYSLSFSLTPHFDDFLYTSSITAIRILEHSLRLNSSNNSDNITFPRHQNRRFPYYIKSPSFNDDFIFYSNILPFEMQNVSFNISRDFERGTRRNLPLGSNVKHFELHSTWKALDGDLSTCWYTNREIRVNDFFAIDFLSIQDSVIFKLAVTHGSRLQKRLDLRISLDGLRWLSYQSLNGIYIKRSAMLEQLLYIFLFDSNEFNSGFKSFRYISFNANKDFNANFEVCEITIVSKNDINNIKRDFHRLAV